MLLISVQHYVCIQVLWILNKEVLSNIRMVFGSLCCHTTSVNEEIEQKCVYYKKNKSGLEV